MEKKEAIWVAIVFGLVLLAFIVPYTVLREVNAWYGSFLFWTIIAVVIIVVNTLITKDWGE